MLFVGLELFTVEIYALSSSFETISVKSVWYSSVLEIEYRGWGSWKCVYGKEGRAIGYLVVLIICTLAVDSVKRVVSELSTAL